MASIGKSVINLQIGKLGLFLPTLERKECAKDQWLDLSAWKVLLVAFGDSRASLSQSSLLTLGLGECGIRLSSVCGSLEPVHTPCCIPCTTGPFLREPL